MTTLKGICFSEKDLSNKELLLQIINMYRTKGVCPSRCMTCPHPIVSLCRIFNEVILPIETKELLRYEIIKSLYEKLMYLRRCYES